MGKLRKAEYIAKYGEEAWAVESARRSETRKRCYQKNKEKYKDCTKQYYKTQLGRAKYLKHGYNQKDINRGFSTDKNIDETWIMENVFSGQRCIYCGESDWRKLGVDRIDNTKGHTPDNCVCSCWDCNKERKDRFTVEEFIQYRKLHPREQPIPDADDKVINAWKGRFKISSKSIRV